MLAKQESKLEMLVGNCFHLNMESSLMAEFLTETQIKTITLTPRILMTSLLELSLEKLPVANMYLDQS